MWVTVGRDTDGPALAARISEVIAVGDGGGPAFTSLEQAGSALAGALAGRGRTLLVVDDLWTAAQLQPFALAGQSCRLLVTTRRPAVLDNVVARRITVDALPVGAARRLLIRDLPAMPARLERELADLTGRWPLLLNLVNQRLADDVRRGAGIDAAASAAARRLRLGGPAALDVADSGMRETAVAATVGYSLDGLDAADRDRFSELAIFAEDAEVPVAMAALLWQGTARLSTAASESLCERLDGLSLLTPDVGRSGSGACDGHARRHPRFRAPPSWFSRAGRRSCRPSGRCQAGDRTRYSRSNPVVRGRMQCRKRRNGVVAAAGDSRLRVPGVPDLPSAGRRPGR